MATHNALARGYTIVGEFLAAASLILGGGLLVGVATLV
jgi:hypothetical protein